MKKVLFSVFFILISCSGGHDLKQYDNVYFLEGLSPEINRYEVIDWPAGLEGEKILSRGIIINQDLIRLSTKTKEFLSSEYRVDSWLYRFLRINNDGKKEFLGQTSIHFDRITRSFTNFSVIFYYGAAAVSQRFRNFKCPAFEHRKKIHEVNLNDFGKKTDKLYVDRSEPIISDINSGHLFPINFNAGGSLEGEYLVEMALYSSSLRTTYSKWLPLLKKVIVEKEHNISVPSCIGIKEEEKSFSENSPLDIRKLEIK